MKITSGFIKITSGIFCVLLLSHIGVTNAVTLNRVETQMVKQVTIDEPKARALLKKVVNINSGTMNFEGVKQVGDIFALELRQLGFATKWIDGKAFNRSGHLFAERLGKSDTQRRAPKILMIGHLDTVFSKDSAVQEYIEVDDTTVKGPGIIDMKGGDVIIIYALKALKDAGILDQFSIAVVMTGDEEKRGRPLDIATKVLIDSAKWADIALGFENGDGDPKTAVTSRRGYTGWQLEVSGKPAHSSQIFREDMGYGAIYETARILNSFRTQLSTEPNLTFNPGLIVGGTQAELDTGSAKAKGYGKQNVIAQTTKVSGDLRALSPQQQEKAQQAMRKIVANHLPHTSATITFEPGYPPMEPSDGNNQLLSLYDDASRDLGLGPVKAVDPRRAGAADISFTAKHVDMAMDGLGLMGHASHTDDETADIRTLATQTKRAVLLMYRLLDR
ncbi:MAG: M20/M25/M40 family metallo-hydrolase [Algicola sp.]|nr:M20/M25/M40 family metallo-hydrolase [Algicola sp.]